LVQISTHPYENKYSGQQQTNAITEHVQWLSDLSKPSGEKLPVSLRTNNNRLHAHSKHLNGSYHWKHGRFLEVYHQHFSHEQAWPQYNHKQWNSEPNLVISSPCISGIYLWYWSISLQRMTKASLFSNWALC
jgi:hypothetical protein